jgi:hypothetical protein
MRSEIGLALAVLGLALLTVAALRRWTRLVLWGVVGLGAAYAVVLPSINITTAAVTGPLVAGGLFTAAEGVFLAATRGTVPKPEPTRSVAWLATVALGAIAVSALVLVIATVPIGRSLLATIVGTAAAVGLVALLSRRARGDG